MPLFTGPSIWTMIHGIALGGGALMALFAALFFLYATRTAHESGADLAVASRAVATLTLLAAVALWLTVLVGTYVIFPPYRATPPEGITELAAYPRFLIESNPGTVWLHAFAMETKEHVPWIASILATAVGFVATRHREGVLRDTQLRRTTMILLGICLVLVAYVALMGVFVNKVAPVQ